MRDCYAENQLHLQGTQNVAQYRNLYLHPMQPKQSKTHLNPNMISSLKSKL